MDSIVITENLLSVEEASNFVGDNGAGGISVFVGTTRDNFNGKQVVRLEYECYKPMATKEMQKISNTMREKFGIVKTAIHHRLGPCPIGEASVVIAASSPHRKEAMHAVEFAIDKLKETVPIWKKEVYSDGSVWKENAESRHAFANTVSE
eukprot:m.87712 g.87712  ORF g.87712 m.87712 type:complete len:150 (+) comp26111_c2_seq1:441-890(+)